MTLFKIADQYVKESSWKTLALLKICLFALGVLAGMQIPREKRKMVFHMGSLLFLATYIPLMGKFLGILLRKDFYHHQLLKCHEIFISLKNCISGVLFKKQLVKTTIEPSLSVTCSSLSQSFL